MGRGRDAPRVLGNKKRDCVDNAYYRTATHKYKILKYVSVGQIRFWSPVTNFLGWPKSSFGFFHKTVWLSPRGRGLVTPSIVQVPLGILKHHANLDHQTLDYQ